MFEIVNINLKDEEKQNELNKQTSIINIVPTPKMGVVVGVDNNLRIYLLYIHNAITLYKMPKRKPTNLHACVRMRQRLCLN